ncbi:hypothetical protein D049_4964A, partial [Vibrio parahaemolyticus VPTS-2010]
MVGLF